MVDLLEILAESRSPMTIAEIAEALGVHRSIAYRYLRTLTHRRLLRVGGDGRYELGVGLIAIANSVAGDVRSLAGPTLQALADEMGASAFLTRIDGPRTICLMAVEPRDLPGFVVIRPGTYGPLGQGAPALAIRAGAPAESSEPDEVSQARTRGYAYSAEALIPGVESVACAIAAQGAAPDTSVAVIFAKGSQDVDAAARAVMRAAAEISGIIS
ncbi:MAG TPA: helix-turn-helix domain-containing protein [Amycolatopsis sp.]|nr:helix-turn-helix domain-containing protein [Amycolatopsis sp.]